MRVLIVSLEYSRAQRMRSLAEGLTHAGHEVLFLTSAADPGTAPFRILSVPFTSLGGATKQAVGLSADSNLADEARGSSRFLEWAVRTAARIVNEFVLHPDAKRAWIRACKRWIDTKPEALGAIDVVIASNPPTSALYIGRMLSRATGAPLIIDWRDLWTDNYNYPYGAVRRLIDRRAERRLVRFADAHAVVTSGIERILLARYPDVVCKTVYTGVDPEPWASDRDLPDDGLMHIAHVGVWYEGRRTIRPLLDSIVRLGEAGRVDPGKVRIDMYGIVDDTVMRDAEETGLADIVTCHGWVDPDDVKDVLLDTHVALLLAWKEDMDSVPLKIHHYLASGRTIMVINAGEGSEIRRVLDGLPGVVFADDPESSDAALLALYDEWKTRNGRVWTTDERPLPVSIDTMTSGFAELISKVTKNRT